MATHPPALFVGIGNPGQQYNGTRHNLGYDLIDRIAATWQTQFRHQKKFSGHTAQARQNNTIIHLLKPDTYVNESGRAVQAMAGFYQVSPEQIIILHDDLDLPPGTVRIKQGGGPGGHNGLRDIIQTLDTKNFWRIRIGIGHPGNPNQVTPYVLSQPTTTERQQYDQAIARTMDQLHHITSGSMEQAQQQLHGKEEH